MTIANIIGGYEYILHAVAELTVCTLELIGIAIIVLGSVRAITLAVSRFIKKEHSSVVINLAKSLALALEFKMGAEIVNTVIVRELEELGILAIVIVLRGLLAFLIYWDIRNEQKIEREEAEIERIAADSAKPGEETENKK